MEYPMLLEALNLQTPIPNAYSAKLDFIEAFYIQLSVMPKAIALLKDIDIVQADILQCLDEIIFLKDNRSNFEKAVQQSHEATKERNQKYFLLQQWMRDFLAVVKVALQDHPNILASWGLRVK
ncbi:MAG: hypothetical protein OIF50_01350 [Flavobacteriaceae bacterium]|nr:hypothetical protein [Flavobacteriaceae bacterium]